jgi:hypothetical protein
MLKLHQIISNVLLSILAKYTICFGFGKQKRMKKKKNCKYLAAVIINELYKLEITCNGMEHGAWSSHHIENNICSKNNIMQNL